MARNAPRVPHRSIGGRARRARRRSGARLRARAYECGAASARADLRNGIAGRREGHATRTRRRAGRRTGRTHAGCDRARAARSRRAQVRRRGWRDIGRRGAGARRRNAAHRQADRSRRAGDRDHRCATARARAQVGQLRRRRFLREGAASTRRRRAMTLAIHANSEAKVREEICVTGASLYERGYTVGSAGNISARLDDGWLITPTDACLGRLDPAQIAKVDLEGNAVSGGKPSKTLALHRGVYERNREARGIVHTHSTHLVALTLAGVWNDADVLPPITPYYVMKVGHIPLIRYRRPGDPQVAQQIAALAESVRGVLLERLGPVVWERSVSQASYVLEELEETARLWLMTNPRPASLDEAALEELRAVFGARW